MIRKFAAPIALAVLAPSIVSGQTPSAVFDSAFYAWEDGRFVDALEGMDRLLGGASAQAVLKDIALLTGEWYVTTEITADGLSPRWSPDGRMVAYNRGAIENMTTHVVDVATGREVGSVNGGGLVFAPEGGRWAWLRLEASAEYTRAREEMERLQAARDVPAMRAKAAEVQRLERSLTRVMIGGPDAERAIPTGDLGAIGLVWPQGSSLPLVVAAAPGTQDAGVYRPANGRLEPVFAPEGPISAVTALGDGRMLLTSRDRIVIVDPSTRNMIRLQGTQPSATRDGSTIVYLTSGSEGSAIHTVDAQGTDRTVFTSTVPIANPVVSPDGSRIAFQMMPREDWELYAIPAQGGSEPVQVTREIQHDLFPQFISDTQLLAVKGEGRHRRSYIYDLAAIDASGGAAEALASTTGWTRPWQTRLFHNNTVRTVAPEYEWYVSPDGTKVLIVAERDGDTVSPERGVYVTDLTKTVTSDDVRRRIAANLAVERAIAAVGERAFGPIRADVARVTENVSVSRIYGYASDLYQFGSKFITQPGNQKAIDYLVATLRSFGYEPELQWFEPRPGVRTANVIAKLPGTTDPDLIYVVSSHFDSVERGPGADDDSSGSTALLEAARVLAGQPQPRTLHFAFFTGEEAGLLGSREYVRRAQANGDKIVGALNNDMIGYANDQRLDNTIRYSNEGIRDIQHAAAQLFSELITYDAKYYKNTDAHAYYEAYGDIVGGIGSYPILANPHYHQSHDVLETINQKLVAEVSKTTVATLMALSNAPSRVTGLAAERNGSGVQLRWNASPESDVEAYIVEVGAPGAEPRTMRVTEPRASLTNARAGDIVRVHALNARGLRSWDRAEMVMR